MFVQDDPDDPVNGRASILVAFTGSNIHPTSLLTAAPFFRLWLCHNLNCQVVRFTGPPFPWLNSSTTGSDELSVQFPAASPNATAVSASTSQQPTPMSVHKGFYTFNQCVI